MISEISSLQSLFKDRLLSGGSSAAILEHLTDQGPFMKVYDNAYIARLLEVMGEDFPGVHTLLGDDEFAKAASDYIRACPSSEPSIRWLGQEFSEWLKGETPWNRLPVLSDMAAFEWALGLAFDAKDEATVEASILSSTPQEAWPNLIFSFHPALNVINLTYNVIPFHQSVKREEEPDEIPEKLAAKEAWAIWRNPESLQVFYRPLDEIEAAGLNALRSGLTFSALCETLDGMGTEVDASLYAAQLLATWIDAGWITGLMVEGYSWSTG